jgi:hypothetical protein
MQPSTWQITHEPTTSPLPAANDFPPITELIPLSTRAPTLLVIKEPTPQPPISQDTDDPNAPALLETSSAVQCDGFISALALGAVVLQFRIFRHVGASSIEYRGGGEFEHIEYQPV